MVLSYSQCNISVAPVRKEPAHTSEQVSQLIFGEKAEILDVTQNDWAKIRTEWDGYEGWCRLGQLNIVDRKSFRKPVRFISGKHTGKLVFEQSELLLPLGAELSRSKMTLGNATGRFKGKKIRPGDLKFDREALKSAVMQFLNAPYLWGGKTIAGIDCSGLTQMAFRLCNRPLPRDAYQQAEQGETVDFLQNALCGDLAFFDNTEGRIVHVGMLLDHQTIIHATDTSGRVVTDRIDQGGIISVTLRKRTHNLRLVKRYL